MYANKGNEEEGDNFYEFYLSNITLAHPYVWTPIYRGRPSQSVILLDPS